MISGSVRRNASRAIRGFAQTSRIASAAQGVSPSPATSASGPTVGVPPAAPKANVTPLVVPVAPKSTPPPPPPPKKKRTSLTGLLLKTFLLLSTVYGGTLYVATKNDTVLDFVIDKQLPYHEELLDLIEKGSIEDIQKKISELQDSWKNFEVKIPSLDDLKERGEELISESKKVTKKVTSKAASSIPSPPAAVGTPAEQLQKPVETIHKAIESLPLPLVQLKDGADASIKSTIDSFNQLIKSISTNNSTANNDALLKAINEKITILSDKLKNLTDGFDNELQKSLKLSQTDLLSSYTKKELELTENFLHQFNQEKSQLEKKLHKQLIQEIEATKETISQAAVNAVTLMRVEQTKNFEKLIKDRVDQERDGRLNNLTNVNARLEKLESFATNLEEQLISNHSKTQIQKSLSKIKSLIFNPNFEGEQPLLLDSYVEELTKNVNESKDELLKLAVVDLSSVTKKESTHSILNSTQLLTRWEQLAPELRSSSLLPPNAGLLGHLSSIIFSKLLVPTKGAKPDGKDIESVIGRVEQLLSRGQLDVAVEEASNLKGWSRKLADDWVIEGRKRLEVEFLVNLIDSETRLL